MAGWNEKIIFVLSPDKVVRETSIGKGECLACEAKGKLVHRLGSSWEKGHEYLFKDILIHQHWCPMNKLLYSKGNRNRL
jgi:hypothetical protein